MKAYVHKGSEQSRTSLIITSLNIPKSGMIPDLEPMATHLRLAYRRHFESISQCRIVVQACLEGLPQARAESTSTQYACEYLSDVFWQGSQSMHDLVTPSTQPNGVLAQSKSHHGQCHHLRPSPYRCKEGFTTAPVMCCPYLQRGAQSSVSKAAMQYKDAC